MTPEEAVESALEAARGAGATDADAVVVERDHLAVGVRLGNVEKLKSTRERHLGLRVLLGGRTALVSSADLRPETIREIASDAVTRARLTGRDPCVDLPPTPEILPDSSALDLFDPAVATLEPAAALDLAGRAEAAARATDPRITNSEGASTERTAQHVTYGRTDGWLGSYRSSRIWVSVVPVAAAHGEMQRDAWYDCACHLDALESPEAIGAHAAVRALRRLGARAVATTRVPVVFDPETGASLLHHVAAALCGPALYRRASCFLDRLGHTVAAPGVTVIDDGTLVRGLASRPFDAEGIPSQRTTVIEQGTLHSYLLDSYSARRLGLAATSNGTRGAADPPTAAPTNLWLEPGTFSPEEIIRSVERGFYVTELIGFGVNLVTGDYSRGAAGLWIEHGELTRAVEEVTIAGTLLDMLLDIECIGHDLRRRGRIAAPTFRVREMTVAGR